MNSKEYMINVMADVIGLDDNYTGDKLNDSDVWEKFIDNLFYRIDNIENEGVREILNSVDKETFQFWIDDPSFWLDIDKEIVRRGNFVKTIIPQSHQGHC